MGCNRSLSLNEPFANVVQSVFVVGEECGDRLMVWSSQLSSSHTQPHMLHESSLHAMSGATSCSTHLDQLLPELCEVRCRSCSIQGNIHHDCECMIDGLPGIAAAATGRHVADTAQECCCCCPDLIKTVGVRYDLHKQNNGPTSAREHWHGPQSSAALAQQIQAHGHNCSEHMTVTSAPWCKPG